MTWFSPVTWLGPVVFGAPGALTFQVVFATPVNGLALGLLCISEAIGSRWAAAAGAMLFAAYLAGQVGLCWAGQAPPPGPDGALPLAVVACAALWMARRALRGFGPRPRR